MGRCAGGPEEQQPGSAARKIQPWVSPTVLGFSSKGGTEQPRTVLYTPSQTAERMTCPDFVLGLPL